jgi:hypothetical protein
MNAGKLQKRDRRYHCSGKISDAVGILWAERAKLYKPML